MIRAMLFTLVPLVLIGCQSVPTNAPQEFHQAKQAIDKADSEGVKNVFPRGIERAERLLADARGLLSESESRLQDGQLDVGNTLREQATTKAARAHEVAMTIIEAHQRMSEWDGNPDEFRQLMASADRASQLEEQLTAAELERLELSRQNEELSGNEARMQEMQVTIDTMLGIPDDFRVAKPIAYFSTGSTSIPGRHAEEIDELIQLMQQYPSLSVRLSGHADQRGPAELNQRLSRERAEAVKQRLIQNGIDEGRVEIAALGATRALAQEMEQGGLQLDRKVVAQLEVAREPAAVAD